MRRYLLALAALFAPLSGLCAQAEPSPARAALATYLEAFNSGDSARLEQFRRRYGYDREVADVQELREFTGGFDLLRVERETPNSLVARVRWRDGEMREELRTLTLGEGPAPSITIVGERQPVTRLGQAAALAGLEARLRQLAAAGGFAGTLLVARHGRVLFRHAYGEADRARHLPMRLDARIRIASAGKMFTAVAVLQLVASGRVRLDGTIGDYLPDYPNREIATKVTIRQLLTHRGGTGDVDTIDVDWAGDRSRFRTLADYVAAYGGRAPSFEPGTRVEYSNYGFILLGRIIEVVTGREYQAVIEDRVFRPAGMIRSGYEPEHVDVPGRAVPYARREGRLVDVASRYPWRGLPAGGGYTTAGDLFRFAQALQSGRLLRPDLLREATTPQNGEGWYGFGFVTVGEGRERHFGHGGDYPGSNAWFFIYPETGWVTIALSNLDPPAAYRPFRWFEPRMPID
ncbi:MAG TPA: serine hydrolase domain-containing protein [Allosphingosinicella sp.]|nr:serine hydrolase domain-containing protein [Allosphingosinicella sp.]